MQELTAEQKIRALLAGSPVEDPHFQHEGDQVVRWVTGGSMPDAYVTFQHEGEQVIARCATCKAIIGHFPADYERNETASQLIAIRLAGHEHTPVKG